MNFDDPAEWREVTDWVATCDCGKRLGRWAAHAEARREARNHEGRSRKGYHRVTIVKSPSLVLRGPGQGEPQW